MITFLDFIFYWLSFTAVIVSVYLFLVIRRTMMNPEKSLLNSALSIALTPVRYFKLGPYKYGSKITLSGAMKYAMKKAKLNDFGVTKEANFQEHYELIMNSKEYKDQKLTNLGFIFASNELNLSFVRRLKFIEYMKQNPELLNVRVQCPVFVMGLPRTGTTFMHRLLSLDPAVRSPLLWELLNPVPTASGTASKEDMAKDREKRADFIRQLLKSRDMLGDSSMDHIHEIDADQPEECLISIADEMPLQMQFLYPDYMNIEQFMSLPSLPAYKWYRKVLQLLSYQVPEERENPRRWTLKCPMHLFYIKSISSAFPDAKIIWTHRHPVSAIPSMCSLIKAFHKFYYDPSGRDDAKLGRQVADVTAKYIHQAPKDIAESGLDNAHVIYNELIKDPKGVIKKIYSKFNWKYSEEYDILLDKYLAKNEKDRLAMKSKGGVLHKYEPEEFGLTADELSNGPFAAYANKFEVPMSKN